MTAPPLPDAGKEPEPDLSPDLCPEPAVDPCLDLRPDLQSDPIPEPRPDLLSDLVPVPELQPDPRTAPAGHFADPEGPADLPFPLPGPLSRITLPPSPSPVTALPAEPLSARGEETIPEDGLFTGRIISSGDDDLLSVELEGRILHASRAFSLLLDPLPGDMVLCLADQDQIMVLEILSSPRQEQRTLHLPPQTLLDAREELVLRADSITLSAREITARADTVTEDAREITMKAETMTTDCARITEKSRTRVTRTENLREEVSQTATRHVGSEHVTVQGTASLDAGKFTLNAKGTVHIDGSKINLG